jgi:HSP20 family protein
MSLIKRPERSALGGSLLSDFFDDDRFFNSPWLRGQNLPAINVKDKEKNYEVELAVPGYNKSDFSISLDSGLLTVSAERKEEKERQEDNYTRKEFGYSSFTHSFKLPENVNQEDVQATYVDGILRLNIQKKEPAQLKQSKTISVK